MRSGIEEKVRAELSGWFLISDELVQRLQEETAALGHIVTDLIALLAQVGEIENEVRQLAQRQQEQVDAQFCAWLANRCRRWSIDLEKLGTECEQVAELRRDRAALLQIETQVRLYDEAVKQLREAERVLGAIGSNLQAAELAAELPALRQSLYGNLVDHQWLSRIRGLIQPLRAAAERVQDPPPELRTVASLLTELRGWSKLLGERSDQIQELEELHHFYALEWNPAAVHELMEKAEGLRQQLTQKAWSVRSQKLATLEEKTADLFQACGRQPQLEDELASLKSRAFDRHQLFRDWLSHYDRVEEIFQSLAKTQELALEQRLTGLAADLDERLAKLVDLPLSDHVREEVQGLVHDRGRLDLFTGAEGILEKLHDSNRLLREIDRLIQDAEQEFEDVKTSKEQLRKENEALQAEARRVGIALADLAPRIEELSRGNPGEGSLERAQQSAKLLETELEALRAHLVQRCHEMLTAQLQSVRSATEILRQAGGSPPALELPALLPNAAPADATRAVGKAKELYQRLLQESRALTRALDSKREEARAKLAQLRLDDLSPGDRQVAEQLLRELEEGSWSRTRNPLQRLQGLARLMDKCALFSDRLLQEEKSARERLVDLRQRLHAFRDEQLHLFCPELTERVTALVYGVPEQVSQWNAVHHQLDQAAALFCRVEIQAQRLAIEKLERSIKVLRQRERSSKDAAARARAHQIVAELDALGRSEPVSLNLRLRVENAVQQRV